MKAITKGMHAMHAARRTCEVNPNPRSFTEVSHPFSDRRFSLPVYNIETNILSIGHAGFSCRILARFEDRHSGGTSEEYAMLCSTNVALPN